jgi:hypothetical protein
MPDLIESLQGRDLGHLQIVASFWGIKLEQQDPHQAINQLAASLLESSAAKELVAKLPIEAGNALGDLIRHDGRLPWAQFTRTHGEVREIGAAKRDRERPYEQPISVTEVLWYRGLIARAFFDTPTGPEEFAYIPDNLLEMIPKPGGSDEPWLGRQASSQEYSQVFPVSDRILDHSCTVLAGLRLGISPPEVFEPSMGEELTSAFIKSLLAVCGLLDEAGNPNPEPVRLFLEAKRGEALAQLFQAWKQASAINELGLLPELILEGNWENDPVKTRALMLKYLAHLPAGKWWSLGSFISAVKQRNPDFQRPAGDYDSWFIRQRSSGEYLRGFEHWDEVDGRLIRYLLTGPLHWLGVLDLAGVEGAQAVSSFRLSGWSRALLKGDSPRGLPVEEEALIVRSDARISAKRLVPRRVRYQAARFCEWVKETPEEYQYRISPASLLRARQQGLSVSQFVALINRSAKAVPPSLIKALERWDRQGTEARLEKMVVLTVVSEEVLQALRKSRASRFLGLSLGPMTIAIKPGAVEKVLGALAELGYLGEVRGDGE